MGVSLFGVYSPLTQMVALIRTSTPRATHTMLEREKYIATLQDMLYD